MFAIFWISILLPSMLDVGLSRKVDHYPGVPSGEGLPTRAVYVLDCKRRIVGPDVGAVDLRQAQSNP